MVLPFLISVLFVLLSTGLKAQIVQDSSFEDGSPNAYWTEYSYNFSRVICDMGCNGPASNVPYSGTHFLWLGGSPTPEVAWAKQRVLIPKANKAFLSFYLKIPIIDPASTSFLAVMLDSTSVFHVTTQDTTKYRYEYQQVLVDVSAYADSNWHDLKFYVQQHKVIRLTNFLVDDVSIQIVTGLDRSERLPQKVKVYPNPSQGVFHVDLVPFMITDEVEYKVYSASGELLINENFQPLDQQLEVDLNQYPAGIYHLQILHKKQSFYARLVVH